MLQTLLLFFATHSNDPVFSNIFLLHFSYLPVDATEQTFCTFPRILAGKEGFIECANFSSHYPCPANSSHLSQRSTVCDDMPCNDCDQSQVSHGSGPGFKCLSNNSYCVLPQVLLYDDVPDCEKGEDLCFSGR